VGGGGPVKKDEGFPWRKRDEEDHFYHTWGKTPPGLPGKGEETKLLGRTVEGREEIYLMQGRKGKRERRPLLAQE